MGVPLGPATTVARSHVLHCSCTRAEDCDCLAKRSTPRSAALQSTHPLLGRHRYTGEHRHRRTGQTGSSRLKSKRRSVPSERSMRTQRPGTHLEATNLHQSLGTCRRRFRSSFHIGNSRCCLDRRSVATHSRAGGAVGLGLALCHSCLAG